MSLAQSARFSIIQATAWRIVAELSRRHAKEQDLQISSLHPGSSVHGCLLLKFLGRGQHPSARQPLMLALGGPPDVRGRYVLGFDLWNGTDFVSPMLSAHPETLVDEIDTRLGLVTPKSLQPSTDAVLALRCIAEVLEFQALARQAVRASPAYFELNGGGLIHRWVDLCHPEIAAERIQLMQEGADTEAARAWASQFVAMYPDSYDESTPEEEAPRAMAVFQLSEGTVHLAREGGLVETIDIRSAYVANGRSLSELAHKVSSSLLSRCSTPILT